MEKTKHQVTMSGSELADLIQAYETKIEEATDVDLEEHFRAKLKALLYDVRDPLKYALRLVDAENETKAP